MKIEILIDDKKHIYHVSKTCNFNLIVREGKIVEALESKKTAPVE